MKLKKYFFGMFACAALCACSNDDSDLSNDKPNVFTGDEAYINVRLMDAGNAMGRATNGDFEYGTADEHAVKSAHFYFYDQNKNLVAQSNDWNGGNAVTENNDKNIEFKSNAIVVLRGLTEKNFPTYMVTVLNKPESFQPENTLDAMEKKLSEQDKEGIKTVQTSGEDNINYFVMSTSSYKHATLTEEGATTCPYFVTEVTEDNFAATESAAKATTPVEVYVERLAAKVTLTVDDEKLKDNKKTIEEGNRTLYKLSSATIAGTENAGGGEEIYAELLGWKLNATAKYSCMMKNIDEAWTDQALGFTWNAANNYRSYWGKSFNYEGSTTNYSYPTTAANYETNKTKYPLNYYSLSDNPLALGGIAYCAENTNSSTVVNANFPSAVTGILLKAKVCDASGNALDLVRHKGLLYTKVQFFNYVLNTLQGSTQGLNAYIKKTDDTYEQIGNEFLTWTNVADGKIKVTIDEKKVNLTSTEVTDKTMLYKKGEGESQYSQITDLNELNTALANDAFKDAIGYNGGLMYYNIPIEHLNETASADGSIPEGKYGVVRNHYYKVTINKLENIGKGIFDPTEVIVPQEDDKYYYVSANINILSWKLVNQNVDL